MIKILFICHGNICRSPMAEFVMKDMVQKYSYTQVGKAYAEIIRSIASRTDR